MNRILSLSILLGLCLSLTSCSGSGDGWQKVTVPGGDYSIEFPGEPTERSHQAQTEKGLIRIEMQVLDLGDLEFLSSYAVYPPGFLPAIGNSDEEILAKSAGATLAKMEGSELVKKAKVTVQGFPGLAQQFTYLQGDETLVSFHRVLMIQGRLYTQQMEVTQKRYDAEREKLDESLTRFLDSFQWEGQKSVE